MGIRGGQIRDETIESVDLASGSIKAAEADEQMISGQPTLGSADTTNDRLLIWDADGSVSGALKQIAPANLGVTASPGGSDTQVQFNDGGSFAGNSGLTFNKTSGILTVDKGAVFNEGSYDSDFRVEGNNNPNMIFVNAGSDRVGIGTDAPLGTLHVSASAALETTVIIQGQTDAGIRLAADRANVDEGNNPYIDFYQDGANPISRNSRLATIAMEGDAGATFTDSLANTFFVDAFAPSSQNSNIRTIQFANDSSNNGHKARITIEGDYGYVGIHTNDPSAELEVNGDAKVSGQITAATQPAFLARKPSNNQDSFAIDTGVDVTLSTEDFDVGSNFASNTFTAPTTGVYIFTANVYLTNLDTDATNYSLDLVTTAGTYRLAIIDPGGFSADVGEYTLNGSMPLLLTAGDTAKIQVYQAGGSQQTNIRGAGTRGTFFAGYLLG